LGLPAGRSRIGLVKGVVPMPKLPEVSILTRIGTSGQLGTFAAPHNCSGSGFRQPWQPGNWVAAPGSNSTSDLQGKTGQHNCSGLHPRQQVVPWSCCLQESICTIVRFYIPGSRLVLAAVPRQLSPGRLAQLCGFFPGRFHAATPFFDTPHFEKKLLTLYNIYGNLWY